MTKRGGGVKKGLKYDDVIVEQPIMNKAWYKLSAPVSRLIQMPEHFHRQCVIDVKEIYFDGKH